MIVADTTLLIHIAVPSSKPADADAAEAVARRDAVWIVPPVWASEVRHVVAKYVRGAFMTSENALSVVRRIETLVVVTPVSHEEVLDAAFRFELSGYDAEYAALAERLGVPLVTSDKRVVFSVPHAVTPAAFVA